MLMSYTKVQTSDFETMLDRAQAGDQVYCDPPYVPKTATSNFTAYTEESFDWATQLRLAQAAVNARNRGVAVLISNLDSPLVREELYKGWMVKAEVQARRRIAADPSARVPTGELIVSPPN